MAVTGISRDFTIRGTLPKTHAHYQAFTWIAVEIYWPSVLLKLPYLLY